MIALTDDVCLWQTGRLIRLAADKRRALHQWDAEAHTVRALRVSPPRQARERPVCDLFQRVGPLDVLTTIRSGSNVGAEQLKNVWNREVVTRKGSKRFVFDKQASLQYFLRKYLLYREDRETFECWPSYRTIGPALRMSKNTVRKYVRLLEEKEFIVTEPTQVQRGDGTKWNGNLKYHVRPIQTVVKRYNERYMREAQIEQERLRLKRLERYAARHPGFKVTVYSTDERE